MSENVDLTLVLERLNEVIKEQRSQRDKLTWLEQNVATRSLVLGLAETMSQLDSAVVVLSERVGALESGR